MPQKDPKEIKKEINKLKNEYARFEAKINHLKHEQNKIVKNILARSEKEEIKKIKQLLK